MSGGALPACRVSVRVQSDPIDVAGLVEWAGDPGSGATALFLGTARNHAPGKTGVTHLEYEVYDELVEPKLTEVVEEAAARWPLYAVAAVHRTGRVEVGEASVAVVASSAHRADAFEAARYVIDELKSRAPIWKKEHWDGGSEWVREDLVHRKEP